MDRALAAVRRMEACLGGFHATCDPALWLREDSPEFAGLAADDADWVRGHAYAAMASGSTDPAVLDQAREDLRTSLSPIVLAGLARYLHALEIGGDWTADLRDASRRIRYNDRYPEFVFDPPPSCCKPHLTCREEIEQTLAGVSARANPCCQTTAVASGEAECCGQASDSLLAVRLQDQDGHSQTLAAILAVGPALVAPFYTRCMNPAKCSLTIANLARTAQDLPGLTRLGLTYDPAFDTAFRLRNYGLDRQFVYGPRARLVRCIRGWPALRGALQLRAGYGGSTVNAHARELLLFDAARTIWRLPPDWLVDFGRIREFAAAIAEKG